MCYLELNFLIDLNQICDCSQPLYLTLGVGMVWCIYCACTDMRSLTNRSSRMQSKKIWSLQRTFSTNCRDCFKARLHVGSDEV